MLQCKAYGRGKSKGRLKVPNSAYDMNSFALLACSKLQRITPCKDCNIVASYIVVVLKRSTLHRVKTATG